MSKRLRQGFTLVEVALFLAVTGLLFIGIAAGVQGSMFQQRYNDSVQNFAEFLRSMYSKVINVENVDTSGGKSEKAIYGKLITFGEKTNLEGKPNDDHAVFSYTIIGNAEETLSSGKTLTDLKNVDANIYIDEGGSVKFAGIVDQYVARWGAEIQTTAGWKQENSYGYEEFKGAILIIRNPRSGTIFTYALEGQTIEANEILKNSVTLQNPLSSLIDGSGVGFRNSEVNFCVDPEGNTIESRRRNVRIIKGARNSSGVEIVEQDNDTETGNKCQ